METRGPSPAHFPIEGRLDDSSTEPRIEGPAHHGLSWQALAVVAGVVLALRLPFLPTTLEDIDSVNFDLGVHAYGPVHYQPHPPGYPVFIAVAKLLHPLFHTHAAGLASVSALASALAVFPLYGLMRCLAAPGTAGIATALILTNPILWFNGVRPMSDLMGFFMVTLTQYLLLRPTLSHERPSSGWVWRLGGLSAGLAVGVRLQAVLLVGPVLAYCALKRRDRDLPRIGPWVAAGVAAWLVPLLYFSDGPLHFVKSFSGLVATALPVEPLVTGWSLRRAATAAINVVVAPWVTPALAIVVWLLAGSGATLWAVFGDRRRLVLVLLLYVPYLAADYLLQATETVRYAIPTVPLPALLMAVALRRLSYSFLPTATLVTVTASMTLPALVTYHVSPSPATEAVHALMTRLTPSEIVVSGHHVFERYLQGLPKGFKVLDEPTEGPSWRASLEYWKTGGRKPVLFLSDPSRTSLLLVGRDSQHVLGHWAWPPRLGAFLQGSRPRQVELVQLDRPQWFADSGFLLTPELGDPDKHRLYVRVPDERNILMVSGSWKNVEGGEMALRIGETETRQWRLARDFMIHAPIGPTRGDDYVLVSLEAPSPVQLTDVWVGPMSRAAIRPGIGFSFPERDHRGDVFRWIAPHAQAHVHLSPGQAGIVTIRGWAPLHYYDHPLTLSLVWNGRSLGTFDIAQPDFRLRVHLPATADALLTMLELRASQQFVPHKRQFISGDRRILSVRIYEMSITP